MSLGRVKQTSPKLSDSEMNSQHAGAEAMRPSYWLQWHLRAWRSDYGYGISGHDVSTDLHDAHDTRLTNQLAVSGAVKNSAGEARAEVVELGAWVS